MRSPSGPLASEHAEPSRALPPVTLPPISSLLHSLEQAHPPPSSHRSFPTSTPTPSRFDLKTSPSLPSMSSSLPFTPPFPSSASATSTSSNDPRQINGGSHYNTSNARTSFQQPSSFLPSELGVNGGNVASRSSYPSGLVANHRDPHSVPRSPTGHHSFVTTSYSPSLPPTSSLSMYPRAETSHRPRSAFRDSSDDDRTPTLERPSFTSASTIKPHPYLQPQSILPGVLSHAPNPWAEGFRREASTSRKRLPAIHIPEVSLPSQKAPFGRPRASSMSTADEYRVIPAWSTASVGGNSEGSSPRPTDSPVEPSDGSTSSRSFGTSTDAFPVGIMPGYAGGLPMAAWGSRSPERPDAHDLHAPPGSSLWQGSGRNTPDIGSLNIGPEWSDVDRRSLHPVASSSRLPPLRGYPSPPWPPAQAFSSQPQGPLLDDDPNGENGRYGCPHCAKRFARPSSLRTHIHSHTGEKPFECEVCGRTFSVQSNLRRHHKIHTKVEGMKVKRGRKDRGSTEEGDDEEGSASGESLREKQENARNS